MHQRPSHRPAFSFLSSSVLPVPIALSITPFEIISIGVVDVIEISLVSFLLYRLYQLMRGTIAVQIALGLGALYLIQVLVRVLNMKILQALFSSISEVFVLAVIVLFQPEIRRLLLVLGQNPLVRRLVNTTAQEEVVTETVAAVKEMSEKKIGALIVFQRSTGLRSYIETGEQINADPSRDLLLAIFHGKNPLHDGAVIIRNRRIEAARCILPVSTTMKLSPQLGLRHRAAVGLTEQTDAFVVVVSEETGNISIAREGTLISKLTVDELRTYLTNALTGQSRSSRSAAASA